MRGGGALQFLHGLKFGGLVRGERRKARAYNGGLGTVPPVGSRGKAPGQGGFELTSFLANETHILQ